MCVHFYETPCKYIGWTLPSTFWLRLSTTLQPMLWLVLVGSVPAYASKFQTYLLFTSPSTEVLIPYLRGFPFIDTWKNMHHKKVHVEFLFVNDSFVLYTSCHILVRISRIGHILCPGSCWLFVLVFHCHSDALFWKHMSCYVTVCCRTYTGFGFRRPSFFF